jgi:hypothetical protein
MKHPYVPTISFGNVLSTITIVGAGVAVWVAMSVSVARAEEKIESLKYQVEIERQASERRVERLEKSVEILIQQTAVLNANVAILVRSQGKQPVIEVN